MAKLKQVIWNSSKIEEATHKYSKGYLLQGAENPFHDINKNGISLKKPNLIYAFNKEERDHYIKASQSVIYFAENFCKVKNENSKIETIKLRDYQYDILDMYASNRFSLVMASRQCGKCVTGDTIINIVEDNKEFSMIIYSLYYNNLKNKSVLDTIKLLIYKLISFLKK